MGQRSVEFGQRLAMLRVQNNMTQAELAARVGADQVQVSRWESGKVFPGAARRRALCEVLGVSAQQLLGDEGRG